MPKVRILSRNIDNYIRDSKHDIHKVHRDYTPEAHPFEEAREYVRALNATKLERSFAKPFLFDLKGNSDAVNILQNNKNRLNSVFSGSYDGVIKEWNLSTQSPNFEIKGHESCINGLAQIENNLLSVSDDKFIKLWDIDPLNTELAATVNGSISSSSSLILKSDKINSTYAPKFQIAAKSGLRCLDSQYSQTQDNFFAVGDTSGDIYVYELNSGRSDPVMNFNWGSDSVTSLNFNPTEPNLMLACGMDRSVSLYDIRKNKALRKVSLMMNSNKCLWNPYNPIQFAVCNEDNNTYLFDTRKLSHASKILRGHISAVMSCCFSPTGRQIVTGGYDKTIKIYKIHGNSSSNAVDTYHTKRMQKIYSVTWTLDNKYILSSSEEFNIRCWKAKAWDRLEYLSAAQKQNRNYAEALKKKYQNYPEIRRISKHRHYSKHIFVQSKQRKESLAKLKRKERNRKLHIPGHETEPARQGMVAREFE